MSTEPRTRTKGRLKRKAANQGPRGEGEKPVPSSPPSTKSRFSQLWSWLREPRLRRDREVVQAWNGRGWVARHKLVVVAATSLVWLGFFCIQAWQNPSIAFLIPSREAEWILHPDNKDLKRHRGTFSDEVVFRKRFTLTRLPQTANASLRAMRERTVWINGRTVHPDRRQGERNWKRAQTIDLRPFLQLGENSIAVHARNREGVAALLFVAAPDGLDLRSGASWEVSKSGSDRWVRAMVAGSPARRPSKTMIVVLVVYGLYLLAATTSSWVKERLGVTGLSAGGGIANHSRVFSPKILIAGVFTWLIGLALFNALSYPPWKGFDTQEHIDYIRHVALTWRFPLATQGWSMYHPPLFYTLAAALYASLSGNIETIQMSALKVVQLIPAASCVGSVLCAYLSLRTLYPDDRQMQLLGVSVTAFLPMNLYMTGMITNETLAAFTISLALYVLLRVGFEKELTGREVCLLGIVNGLALLAKFTAFFICVTTGAILLMRIFEYSPLRKRRLAHLMLFILCTVTVCGWFYLRNIAEFGKPFIGNWDQLSGYRFFQKPGYRTFGFYLKFGSALFDENIKDTLEISFLDGEYATLWGDAHGRFVRTEAQRHLSRGIMLLAVLPTVALLLGFFQSVRAALDPPYPNPSLALVLLTMLTLTSIFYFTLELPFYSTIKAFFFLSLIAPIGVFAARGLRTMAHNLGRFQPLLYAHLGILYALIAATFWYRE